MNPLRQLVTVKNVLQNPIFIFSLIVRCNFLWFLENKSSHVLISDQKKKKSYKNNVTIRPKLYYFSTLTNFSEIWWIEQDFDELGQFSKRFLKISDEITKSFEIKDKPRFCPRIDWDKIINYSLIFWIEIL